MNLNEEIGVFIKDKSGKPRIRIYIDSDNNPKIELLNEEGTVVD